MTLSRKLSPSFLSLLGLPEINLLTMGATLGKQVQNRGYVLLGAPNRSTRVTGVFDGEDRKGSRGAGGAVGWDKGRDERVEGEVVCEVWEGD